MMNSTFREVLPQILAVFVKNILLIGFGMTLGFPTILIASLQNLSNNETDYNLLLNKEQISWISSLNLICVPLGCVFSGSFASFLGRRRSMQLVNIPIFISWIIFFYSNQVYHLYIALFLGGFSGGMLEAPVLTYVAEISIPKIRGMLAATGSTCVILGIFSQFLMATFLSWRSITLVSSCVPIVAVLLLCFVPESPHWLIMKKRKDEAKESLMWLRGWQKSFENVKKEFDELYSNLAQKANTGKKVTRIEAFKKRTFVFPYILCSLSFFIGHFSGMTTLQTYSVIIFSSLNAPMDKFMATTILGILELIGTIICVIFVKFVGKRKLSFFSTIGCGICFLLTAIYAIIISQTKSSIDSNDNFNLTIANTSNLINEIAETAMNVTKRSVDMSSTNLVDLNVSETSEYSWIPLSLLLTSALLSHSGIRLLPWILIGEVFPTEVRGIASGLSGGTGYVFGFLANKMFLSMISAFTLPGTFILYSCISFVGCLALFFILPETENRTLQEIEDHFSGKKTLSHKLIKTSTPVCEPFPKDFNIKTWKSNERFEEYLEQHKYDSNGTYDIRL
ncbi:hypothetical protein PVAND_012447 [Polypedilum vanderplanki]|uniref:Major facilitator superfamily (MFS) profile domain-containing protein n=1 Tax=Polypedilum vanderplanki TaxID=319348 RepID=A0A9J6CMG0_POLVA|nr:hypothetical protein PVAND_012447 [Polypedilum vanderplanki]